jgi:hypothetical protein
VLLACAHCGQRFLSVFTETIDWADGEDPQYWNVLPLEEAEAADLVRRRDSLDEAALARIGEGRRSLKRDFPKNGEPRAYWAAGLRVGPHD